MGKYFFLLLHVLFCVNMKANGNGFYNIAHMTNTIESVRWAMEKGANSVEVDLQFHDDGTPYEIFHVNPCDCTCMCPGGYCSTLYPNSVCTQLEKSSPSNSCDAKSNAKDLLKYIAKQKQMAMVLIDSKITDQGKKMSYETQIDAARKVVAMLETHLFGQGFKGEVIIGAPGFYSSSYITEISKTKSQYRRKIHFTIDQEDMAETKTRLDFKHNKNLVYNIGISACSPTVVADKAKSKLAMLNKNEGVWGMTYTWTLDKHSSLTWYVNYFDGIITNYPGTLATVLKEQGLQLAKPDDAIPPATSSNTIRYGGDYICECTYSSGGCSVTKRAPSGLACQCTYPFLWTCEGWVVLCSDASNPKCKHPDLSKESCLQGRGDCGAY